MNLNEIYKKLKSEKAYCEPTSGQADYNAETEYQAQYLGSSVPPTTLRGAAEAQVGYHREQAEKADQAAAFFRENPAFDQFIRLIRNGTISI